MISPQYSQGEIQICRQKQLININTIHNIRVYLKGLNLKYMD